MFSFGHADRPQFGGVGVMVEPPAVEVTIKPATHFAARGALAHRVEQFSNTAARRWKLDALRACEITAASPPDHVGLGVGTQLGLAVAAGLRRFLNLPELPLEELASSVGRGKRSAVGTYGFRHGGLIVDSGKGPGEALGAMVQRAELPAAWRVVLVRPEQTQALAGDLEADAFARLPAVPLHVTRELWRITNMEILPAVEHADCAAFGDAAYRFGRLAGECFAPVQGGPFASQRIAELLESIRSYGVPGVGQSSWGPTVFAFTADDAQAQALARWLGHTHGIAAADIVIGRPSNRGAQISTLS
jgi:beta-RFAP synthase